MRLKGQHDNRPSGVGSGQTGLGKYLLVGKMYPVEVPNRQHRLGQGRVQRLKTVQDSHRIIPPT